MLNGANTSIYEVDSGGQRLLAKGKLRTIGWKAPARANHGPKKIRLSERGDAMNFIPVTIVAFFFVFSHFLVGSPVFAASVETARAKILAGAKNEGKLRVLSSLDPSSFNALRKAFLNQYPFIQDMQVQEMKGTDSPQKFLLELKSG